MTKSTQRIHKSHIADTPAGPLELAYNLESGWFAVAAPKQIPIAYLDALLTALGVIRSRFQGAADDSTTIRSIETDWEDIEADWEAVKRLMRRQ